MTTYEVSLPTGTLSYLATRSEGVGRSGSIIEVPVGTTVGVYVKVGVSGGHVEGTLTVEVRKDIVWGSNQVLRTMSKTVSLDSGEH